jgi:hypothetical protein
LACIWLRKKQSHVVVLNPLNGVLRTKRLNGITEAPTAKRREEEADDWRFAAVTAFEHGPVDLTHAASSVSASVSQVGAPSQQYAMPRPPHRGHGSLMMPLVRSAK